MKALIQAWLLRALGLLLLVLGLSFAAFRAPDRSLESLVQRWAPPPSQFIELKLADKPQLTHLRDEGPRLDPLPIVLIHGTSDSLHSWDAWTRELSKTRRVIRMDLPGFGLTGPAVSGDYRIGAYVDFMAALFKELKLNRVLLAGNSLGGEVAWMTAARLPEQVAGLVLLDPAGLPFEPEVLPLGFKTSAFTPTAWLGRFLLPRPMVRASVEAVYGDPNRVSAAEVDRFFELTLREGNRAALSARIQAFIQEAHGPLYTQTWPQVRTPTLLIWGERDRLIPPATAKLYQSTRHPEAEPAELIVLPGLGHVPHVEDPQAALKAARPFIDRVSK
ncbi:pimeloyl-ACP methyl ester carboxylesterase [Inhella inkyongensis]|uniref:Pimeloyl-ACP methyl ester carboxylesterase n=1 Tax=Inhella inkyongensis TaxID=392593 RepID=A0A840S4E5_9BURK|nr:alpha/beta hydrolase [Inhella inkyongensis]MBB5203916.1 pimeloyl-ACP methyl ester carboxylesterase [Inhella inkyongensis]